MTLVCEGCREGDHAACTNGPRKDGTWCDCQHRPVR
jgi:hypothetical protein